MSKKNNWGNWCRANVENEVILVSYSTPVAVYQNGVVYIYSWCSNTTAQHIHKFSRYHNCGIQLIERSMFIRLLNKYKYGGSLGWLHAYYGGGRIYEKM